MNEQADTSSAIHRSTWPRLMAGFLPAIALTLLAGVTDHPVAALGYVAALPLYLVAAAGCLDMPGGMGFFTTLTHQLRGGFWAVLVCLAVLAVALYWPANQLAAGGGLAVVLVGSAIIGLALVLLWRRAVIPALLLERSEDSVRGRLRTLGNAAVSGATGWFVAIYLLSLMLSTLVLVWATPWPESSRWIVMPLYAVVVAPLLAWGALAASQQQLERARERIADALAARAVAPTPAQRPHLMNDPNAGAALYAAARAGRIEEALALLDRGANPHGLPPADARDQRTLLMLAAIQSDLRLLRQLIAAGVDLNLSHVGLTALLAAVRDSYHGRPDAVLMLLANGADPSPADMDGQTALHAAARAADPAITALLLDAGAPLDVLDMHGVSPLGVAAGLGNLEVAKYLISRGASCEPQGGEPALLLAAARDEDDPAMVKLLLRHKAHIDARGRLGRRALHAACLNQNPDIVDALLAARAHPDPADDQGVTPLLEAARAGAAVCVERLATHDGVDAAACDTAGRNALVIACTSGNCDSATVKALLAMGVDPQQAAFDGRRAIDHAVAAGRWAHVALLDPGYVLPACLADNDEELQDAPPLMRLRLALGRESFDKVRQLLPLAITSTDALIELYLDLAPRLTRGGALVLADALPRDALDAEGVTLMWRLLALGPAANPALLALLDRAASPVGRGGLARYLNAALLRADSGRESERVALTLLECGADPFGADVDGNPPLIQALRLKWHTLFGALLVRGVDPETRDMYAASALLLACQLDDEHAVRSLISSGAQPSALTSDGQTARGLALSLGHAHLSRWMDWPAWPLPRRWLRDRDLVVAAQYGDLDAVERLLDLGLALNATDAQGCTALLRACGGGHVELVQHLLQRGADHALAAHSGATCLSVALTARQSDVVWALVKNGVAVDQRLPGGITPLMIAAALGQEEPIRALLANGADATAIDEHGGGVLHALAQYGFVARDGAAACAAWGALLNAGADPDAVNGVGETPLLLLLGASFEPGTTCNEEVILAQLDLLLRHGVDTGARERRGFSPLHLAAQHGLRQAVRRLMAAGADPDLRDTLNRSPADIALTRGFVDVAREFSPHEPAPSIARFLREPKD